MRPTSEIEKRGVYKGHEYVIVYNCDGTWEWRCGYVEVPENHPLHKKDYMDVRYKFDVHGGITWSGDLPAQFEKTGKFWFGFDTNHWGDHIGNWIDGYKCMWDTGYIADECKRLIDQLIEIGKVLKEANDG